MKFKKTIIITTAILIFAILTAGCTDTGGANPETTTYTPPPEDVSVVSTPAVEVTQDSSEGTASVETNWYDDRPDYTPAVVDANTNLFGVEIDGVLYDKNDNWYSIYDNNQNLIFQHTEYPNIALYNKLSPDQYKALVDQYGSMKSITMETIDLDRDGTMDKVAIHYVGSGVWDFKDDYKQGWTVADYIGEQKIV